MKMKSRWTSWRPARGKLKKFGIVIGTACVAISVAGTSMAASAPSPTITEVTNGRVTQLWTTPITPAMAQLMQAEAQTTASNSQTTSSQNTESVSPDSFLSGSNTYNVYADGFASSNGNAYGYGDFTATFSHPSLSQVALNASGTIEGIWEGSGVPDSITLQQTLTINGTAVTVSWPPSVGGSSTTTTYSNTWDNVTAVNSPYSGVGATSSIALYSYQQSDMAAFVVGTSALRAYNELSANWLTGAVSYQPSGGTW